MELLVGAVQEAGGFQRRDVGFRGEGDMRGRDAELVGYEFQARREASETRKPA